MSEYQNTAACADRKRKYSELVREVKLYELKIHGYLQCDISNYDGYTMVELIDEFCSEVPCFFDSYDNLQVLFTHRYEKANRAMVILRSCFLEEPRAPVQAKLARIIHQYFRGLPWVNTNINT